MTDPLFIEDIDALKTELRLGNLEEQSDAHVIVERALANVHLHLRVRLGLARVTELAGFEGSVDETEQLLFGIASSLEVLWTRVLLIDTLPTIFMDESGGAQEVYNTEAAFRNSQKDKLDDYRKRSLQQIDEWVAYLKGDLEIGEERSGAFTQEGPCPRIVVGDSLWPGCGPVRFDGNFFQ